MVRVEPTKQALDHAEYTGPTRQRKLDHTGLGIGLPWKSWVFNPFRTADSGLKTIEDKLLGI